MEVKNKVVIVTGASSGIGEALARLLSEKGAKVSLAARSKDKLEKLSKELPNSIAIPTDMTKELEIINLVKKTLVKFGRIDMLINNAGQGYDSLVEKIDVKTFEKIFNLDLAGPVIAMREVIPIMRKQKEGAIVNISSGTALMYLPNMGPYSSIKRALAHITLTAREELEKDNVKVSVVYPYVTITDFEKNTIKEVKEEWEGELPHPPDTPEYIAEKILEGIQKEVSEIYAHDWMKNS